MMISAFFRLMRNKPYDKRVKRRACQHYLRMLCCYWPFFCIACLTLPVGVYGQASRFVCGNDALKQLPSDFNQSITSEVSRPLLSAQLKTALEDTTTYIVPVVFIIYHKGETVGIGSNVSDSALEYMLNHINERFAGIGVNGYRGLDSRIRFVFAKRTQACNPTTGIIRIDGRSVPGYEANGRSSYEIQSQLAALVPDFVDQSTRSGVLVINLYHQVSGGAFAYYGGAVHMTAPTEVDLNPYNYVPPHEVGHSLLLYHPYDGSYLQGNEYTCPTDTYNDLVEDTQPTRNLDPYFACNPDAEQLINSCTGLPFGTQLRNLMTFGCDQDRFTAGQIARMRYFLANDYKQLASSDFSKPLSPGETPAPLACTLSTPTAITGFYYGIANVKFHTIDNSSSVTSSRYTDYTCAYQTKATLGQTIPLRVSGYGTFGRVYIDYNSDGSFDESSELVMSFTTTNEIDQYTATQFVTIPVTAVVNRILHVRVIIDNGNVPPSACIIPGRANQGFGEVEEYGLLLSTPNCESLRSGNWYDATIWSCGQVPSAQSNVLIKTGHTILLNQLTPKAVCRSLVLQGTLSNQQGALVIGEQ